MIFAKIFEQIYDSSIADDWKARIVFQDMLILADKDGIVDKTPEAIARRTNIPLEIVREAIPKLEAPDPASRTPDLDGRRIVRLDEHRTWGWRIVNIHKYRESATREMLRMAEAERKKAYRAKFPKSAPPQTPPKTKEEEGEGDMSRDMSRTCPGRAAQNERGDTLPNPPRSFSREPWQLLNDKRRIEEQIARERERVKPDADVIDGLRAELARTIDEIKALGGATKKKARVTKAEATGVTVMARRLADTFTEGGRKAADELSKLKEAL